jgi:hypothetical protein
MVEQVELTHTRAAATIAKRISAELATFLSLANGLAANPAFADPRSATAQDLLRYNLGAWSRLGVLGIAVVTPQGEQVILAQLPEEESKRRVRQTVHLPPRDLVEVSLQPPPRGRAGKAVGDENVVVTLRLAAPLPEQRGFIWLVADGSVIRDAVVAPEQLGKEAAVTLARRDGDAMLGSLDPYPPDVLELAFNPNVEGVESGFLTAAGTVVGAFSAVTHANWTVLSHHTSASRLRTPWPTTWKENPGGQSSWSLSASCSSQPSHTPRRCDRFGSWLQRKGDSLESPAPPPGARSSSCVPRLMPSKSA